MTVLSTDNYLDGVLVLNESLRRCEASYRLHVVVGSNVGGAARDTLARAGLPRIDSPPLDIPEEIVRSNLRSDAHRHWSGVFEKLHVFSLCQFAKVVYLDSDMLVLKNIDHLFEKRHMSAVLADRYPGNEECIDLNAGLMVIEPERGLTERLITSVPEVFEQEKQWRAAAGRPPSMGVQSVINTFWRGWISKPELQLEAKYNVLTDHLDYYVRRLGYKWRGPDGIHVLHFIGEVKPWMFTGVDRLRRPARLPVRRRVWETAAFIAYMAALGSARLHLRRTPALR